MEQKWSEREWMGEPGKSDFSLYIAALRLASRKLALIVFAASYWNVDKSSLTR